ncbi:MAG: Rpn family recombination-promoting nuclease/putative transposase [Candidatus Cryptobacteroides sp.]
MKIDNVPPMRRYANLTNDYMFKRLFGSEDCKDILIAFLKMVIPDTDIVDVMFNDKEYLGMTEDDGRAIVDISCITGDGSHFIVEMQNAKQEWFRDRAIFYTSYPIMRQRDIAKARFKEKYPDRVDRFVWNFRLTPVRLIAIVNFRIDHLESWSEDRYHSTYRLREDEIGETMSDKLTYTFLELGRFDKTEKELETPYDKWMYLFKNISSLQTRPDSFQEKEFELLFDKAEIANFSPEQFEEYQRREIMDYDYENCLEYKYNEGHKEGRKEEKIATARRMLADGMSADIVAKYSDLPIEKVMEL